MTAATGLIALMGATGSGKSSFTNSILGEDRAVVGDKLDSQTSEVHEYPYILPNGTNVRIVDTPGFDDSRPEGGKSDLEVLQMIAKFLKSKRELEQKFFGIIYMHNITSPRVSRMMRRNMSIFKKLCGNESMKNVVVVTAFWDLVGDTQSGINDEHELQTEDGLLKELYDGGAKFVRAGHFEEGKRPSGEEYLTPQQIVDHLLSLDPVYVQMQKEMAAGVTVIDTRAGASLLKEFEELKQEYRQSIENVNSQLFALKSASEEDRSHRDLLRTDSQKLKDQLDAWEANGLEVKTKMAEWEARQTRIATKEDLEAWRNAHRLDLDGLRLDLDGLKQAKEDANRHQVTVEQQNAELDRALAKVEKERDELSEERRELQRSNRQIQDLYVAQTALTGQREAEKSALKDGLHELQIKLSQAQSTNDSTSERLKSLLLSMERMREELSKRNAEYASLQSDHQKTKDEVMGLKSASQIAQVKFEAERKDLTRQRIESQKLAAESLKEVQRLTEENSKKAAELSDSVYRTVQLQDELERVCAGNAETHGPGSIPGLAGPSDASSEAPSSDHSSTPAQVPYQRYARGRPQAFPRAYSTPPTAPIPSRRGQPTHSGGYPGASTNSVPSNSNYNEPTFLAPHLRNQVAENNNRFQSQSSPQTPSMFMPTPSILDQTGSGPRNSPPSMWHPPQLLHLRGLEN